MIGVRKQVSPALRLVGDAVGRSNMRVLENLCREFPSNRFLVSVLSHENQHELSVYAPKFSQFDAVRMLVVHEQSFDCGGDPSRAHRDVGNYFIPQHSDARVLDQVIYKWNNTRRTLTRILPDTYRLLSEDGRGVTRDDIQRDVTRLFRSNAEAWTGLHSPGSDVPTET